MERGQFIAYQVHVFFPVYLLTNQNVNATTQQLRMVLSPIHAFMSRRHKMCFALMSCEPVYIARVVALCVSLGGRPNVTIAAGWCSKLQICWSLFIRRCFVGRWCWSMVSDGSFWVIVEMKTQKEVVHIFPKMSTGLSLNSCV